MTKQTIGQNMLLFSSHWGDAKTFKLMPVNNECPFTEVIYDPTTTLLVVISKITKETFQNVPRLNDDGEPLRANKPRRSGVAYKEKRVVMHTLQEYYLTDVEEQVEFIKRFAINETSFNYKQYHRNMETEPTIEPVEKQGLVDANGLPIKK